VLSGTREDQATNHALAMGLSERQSEIMHAVVGGASNAQVGVSLGISRRTVEKHLQNIYALLGVTSRTQAVARMQARAAGLASAQ
jgi:LuxR family transcriptional regulator, maltose regulon positive regulatory protein